MSPAAGSTRPWTLYGDPPFPYGIAEGSWCERRESGGVVSCRDVPSGEDANLSKAPRGARWSWGPPCFRLIKLGPDPLKAHNLRICATQGQPPSPTTPRRGATTEQGGAVYVCLECDRVRCDSADGCPIQAANRPRAVGELPHKARTLKL